MDIETRIYPIADYLKPSDGDPIRSVVLETAESVTVAWHVRPGQEIAAHIHPNGQDIWIVLSGRAEYFQGNGVARLLHANEIAVALPGQLHGARNVGAEPFVFISVVSPGDAGFALAEDIPKTPKTT